MSGLIRGLVLICCPKSMPGIAIARSLEVRNEAWGAAGLCVPKWVMNAGARQLPNTPDE